MSSRTFARRFRSEMGTTPAAWLNRQRLMRAQQLLEETDRGLETIAQETGFGTAAVMRHHFVKTLNVSPQSYRRAFGARRPARLSRSCRRCGTCNRRGTRSRRRRPRHPAPR